MNARIFAASSVFTGLAVAVVFVNGCRRTELEISNTGNAPVVRTELATVTLEDAVKSYESTGTVRPKFNSTLSSKVMARVTAVAVRDGDRIQKGQVLVSLDSRELRSAVSMAQANRYSAAVGIKNAETAYLMEVRASAARIAEAEAQVVQARSLLGVAQSRLDLAKAGTRSQEKVQANLAVSQAASNLKLATIELERTKRLVDEGAFARRQLDMAQNAFNQARAQYDTAVQAEKIALEGTRSQEVRAAEQAVAQAAAAVAQAEAGLKSARASSMQVNVRAGDIQAAKAQDKLSAAALDSARSSAGYATVVAPFNGRVVKRHVDAGSMAMPGVPLLTVEGDDLRFEIVAPEAIIGSLNLGNLAPVSIESIGGITFNARVVEVVPQADSSSHTFLARLALPRDVRLKTGMFGRVQVPIGREKKLLIPASATWEVEGLQYIFVVNQEKIARLRIVTIGKRQESRIQVLSGLNPGERIIVGDRSKVQDGSYVEAN